VKIDCLSRNFKRRSLVNRAVSVCDDCHFAVTSRSMPRHRLARQCVLTDGSRVATVGHRNLPFDRAKTVEVNTQCFCSA